MGEFKAKTAQTAEAYRTAGSPVYRVTVAQEIRQALRALPNDRIPDVTVEAITRGGHAIDQLTGSSAITTSTIVHAANIAKRKVSVGDIIRYENEYRQVSSYTNANTYVVTKEFVASISGGSTMFIQNGMAYDITFEAGCRSHRLTGSSRALDQTVRTATWEAHACAV